MMIRRSNECTLGTALALISPQPRARAVSSRAHARVFEELPYIGTPVCWRCIAPNSSRDLIVQAIKARRFTLAGFPIQCRACRTPSQIDIL